MTRIAGCLVWVLLLVSSAAAQTSGSPYFPDRFDWQHRTPQQAGFDAAKLADAIKFATANENPMPKDLALAHPLSYPNEPFGSLIGPVRERAALRWIGNDAALNEFLGKVIGAMPPGVSSSR